MSLFSLFGDDDDTSPDQQPLAPTTPVTPPMAPMSPSPVAGLDDTQKQALYKALQDKYAAASDDSAVKDAQGAVDRANVGSSIGQALADFGAARARARGVNVPVDTNFFGALRSGAANDLASAKSDRAAKIQDVLNQDKLGWEDETRQHQRTDWQRAAAVQKDEDDPNSSTSKNAQALAKKMMPSGNFDGMSATQLKASLPYLEKMYDAEQQRLGKLDDINLRKQDRADAKKQSDDDYNASVKVEGADIQPGFRPTTQNATTVRQAKAAFDAINKQMTDLDALYAKSGTNLVGDDAARQSEIVADIKLQLKNLQTLGALSGSDLKLLQDQIPDPTSLAENAKGMFGSDRYQPKSDQFKKSLANRYDTTLNAYGYKRTSGDTGNVAGGTAAAGGSGVANAATNTPSDPKIADYARSNDMTYSAARALLVKRGYKPNEQ